MKSRKASSKNGQNGSASKRNGQENQTPLEIAIATLIQTQAIVNQQIAQTNQHLDQFRAESREIERENAERFARIEQLLIQHHRMLEELPEAVRQKIGFQKK